MNRRLTISATLAIAAVGLAGCVDSGRDASGSGGSEQAECPWEADDSVTTTARIAWQKVPTADLIVKDRGVLEACMPEASVTWSNFASGGDVLQAYGGQSVDMGLVGSSPTTIALTKGQDRSLPIEVVWIHDIIGEAEALVVRDESATSIKDLEGGTIAVPFASTSHYSLLQALDEAGMGQWLAKQIQTRHLRCELFRRYIQYVKSMNLRAAQPADPRYPGRRSPR